jgi:hypothetical protein
MKEDTEVAWEEVPEAGIAHPRADVVPTVGVRLRPSDVGFVGERVSRSLR